MTTDRELLEQAAKAAGIGVFCWVDVVKDYDSPHHSGSAIQISHSANTWNPLTDDGDALRLAVKLKITILFEFDRVIACYGDGDEGEYETEFLYDTPIPTDPYAATRRAIVRAAAEIGKVEYVK